MSGVNVMGIDPGLSGGIAILGPDGVLMEPVPLDEDGQVDLVELNKILADHAKDIRVAYIEKSQSMPGQSCVAMFNYGKVYGLLQGMLVANGINFIPVRPQEWMKSMHEPSKKDSKERSRIAFSKLFPGVDARRTPRCKGPDMGLVEAALIAEYGRRNYCEF